MLAQKRRDAWEFVAYVAVAFSLWAAGRADKAQKKVK